MLNIFETGDDSFRLADRLDVNVGWVRGSAVGFDGFGSEADAIAAAVAGHEALAAYLDRLTGAGQEAPSRARPRLARDGSSEWVIRGGARLARLYRPRDDDGLDRRNDTFGVEFALPSYVKPGAAISAAQIVHKAIRAAADAKAPAARKGAAKGVATLPLGEPGGGALGAVASDGQATTDAVVAR